MNRYKSEESKSNDEDNLAILIFNDRRQCKYGTTMFTKICESNRLLMLYYSILRLDILKDNAVDPNTYIAVVNKLLKTGILTENNFDLDKSEILFMLDKCPKAVVDYVCSNI